MSGRPRRLKVIRCPTDKLTFTNCAVVNSHDFPSMKNQQQRQHVKMITTESEEVIFTIRQSKKVKKGQIGLSLTQRNFANVSLEEKVNCLPFEFDRSQCISKIVLEVDFLQKQQWTYEAYNTDLMAMDFVAQFGGKSFYKNMPIAFEFKKLKVLRLNIKEIEMVGMNPLNVWDEEKVSKKGQIGVLCFLPKNTKITFEKGEGSKVNLTGNLIGKVTSTKLGINLNWNFQKMGIGGLEKEFDAIFRRAFASRVFPAEVTKQIGCKHVKEILLYGPTGTGKTLMARQIGKMLNLEEPKIVNGPEILGKNIGETNENIRLLFAEAEEEEKRLGLKSRLHIIIFDEIDAICKKRGSVEGERGLHDTVVNQLVSKFDEHLNNFLVIGTTRCRDLIDEALLRAGRLEVQIEINLPDEQILKIHTAIMKQHGILKEDANLEELARLTKNFSGADLEGLVRAAQSAAMNRLTYKQEMEKLQTEEVDRIAEFISKNNLIVNKITIMSIQTLI